MITTPRTRLTFEEYLTYGGESDARHELFHGEPIMTALPIRLHSDIIALLLQVLGLEINRLTLPWLVRNDVGVRTSDDSSRIPDLSIFTKGQWRGVPQASSVLQTAPLLVIEVVSPSTRKTDYRQKRTEYAFIAIPEYWIIDPEEQKVSILLWVEGFYDVVEYQGDQVIVSVTFPHLALTANQILFPSLEV